MTIFHEMADLGADAPGLPTSEYVDELDVVTDALNVLESGGTLEHDQIEVLVEFDEYLDTVPPSVAKMWRPWDQTIVDTLRNTGAIE